MIYILPYQSELAIKAIQTAKEGYECIVRKIKKQRSLPQNRYYRYRLRIVALNTIHSMHGLSAIIFSPCYKL